MGSTGFPTMTTVIEWPQINSEKVSRAREGEAHVVRPVRRLSS